MNLDHIPHHPGVYLMRDRTGKILYIGKAKDLRRRVSSYFRRDLGHPRLVILLSAVRRIDYIPARSEREALLFERRLIHDVQPVYNVEWRDDKTYPSVKLTKEDYPRLVLTRKIEKDGGTYFGPFPEASSVKKLLRALRRRKILPLRPCRFDFREADIVSPGGLEKSRPRLYRKVKSCLYLHTGECPAPCVGKVSRSAYGKMAGDARLFFSGKNLPLASKWRREMERLSRKLDYEGAADLRDRLKAVRQIAETVRIEPVDIGSVESRTKPTRALGLLREALGLPSVPRRIEGFDISNIQGSEPVASLVSFEWGLPDRSAYRKFRIKSVAGQDDFAMMAEAVGRRYGRLCREKGEIPDLVLVDGGKGQLSAALRSLRDVDFRSAGLRAPSLASLAKRDEEVFIPGREEPIRLGKDSPALHVLQRVRDEAHRFAVTYHRLRRKKTLLGPEDRSVS